MEKPDKPPDKPTEKIDILVIEDDVSSQTTLRQILDSDDWRVRIAPVGQAMQELAAGTWTLVIANVAITGLTSPLYTILKELALAPALESGKNRLRVLFIIPEQADPQARPTLESQHLPYLMKPFHLHDLLDRVSDLLLETAAISAPIRRVRQEGLTSGRREARTIRGGSGSSQKAGRNTSMFANYSDYGMTEEEMAEYERQENEELQRKKKKKLYPDSL